MKKANTILILLMMSFSSMAFSYTNSSAQETADKNTQDTLEQYVGEYILKETGMIVEIYTKTNDTKLFLFVDGQPEYELISTGKHKFSFKISDEYKIEFKNPENGVFKELVATQPDGTYTAIRNGEVKIDDLTTIDKKLIEREFSGVILVAQSDSIIFSKAYGKKSNQEVNDLNTVFDICSITKQFTAAGIMTLSMQNKVAVTDKISKYFEGVPEDKKNITIHQLLTHSSGLKDGIGDDYDAITEEKFLKKVFRSKLLSPVGEKFNYSNMGYSLLGLIIEKVSGMDYEAYLSEIIFKPLKMNHTGYIIPDWEHNEVANGFLDGKEAKKPNEENWSDNGPYLHLKGNGGILTKASDLLLWSKAIMNNSVLDEATTAKYLYPHFEWNDMYTHYGYGWGIENDNSENKLVLHGGASDLFASDLWIYPKKGITIIVLSNTQEEYVYSIARKISKFLLAK